MTSAGLTITAVLDNVASHALQLGLFDRVNTHEPKVAPNAGLTAAIWVTAIGPARGGLHTTSVRLGFTVRIQTMFVAEPQDLIDPNLVTACDVLMGAYSADFDAGGLARCVDLKGAEGPPLAAVSGYVDMAKQKYRVFDITLPIIINDAWEQIP